MRGAGKAEGKNVHQKWRGAVESQGGPLFRCPRFFASQEENMQEENNESSRPKRLKHTPTIEDLESGAVARITPTDLAKLMGISYASVRRRILTGVLPARLDPYTERLFIEAKDAIDHLNDSVAADGTFTYKKSGVLIGTKAGGSKRR